MQLNFSDFSAIQRYHLMTQTIIPRPIAWALTDSGDENYNLAPFSYFTAVSSDPALLMISVGKKPNGDNKDTLTNILKNKQMVIHIASADQAELVTQTAATLAHGQSELANSGLTTAAFEDFPLPRLAQCDIAYGCELYEIKELGDVPQTLIFVEVKQLYISDAVVVKDDKDRMKIAADKVKPLARLGGGEYASITAPFSLQRPA
ncbi:flavin reductase family protein [Moritella sp. Urea-trap-13]|uniref:flavin reductase family protein n=1 Tax=Moritella sp. Urea-trap-13 TaxID=2058327 RepID=UPI000C320F77|nr:flavin reductase family protein [Moritella sp. Urea-trap-13]PKH07445.1 flavin reductase family protein [Moritella sp. Urea-trap-13]